MSSSTTTTKRFARVSPSLFVLFAVAAAVSAHAAEVIQEGTHEGANYRIAIPDGWNPETGTLVLYAHGVREKADRPNEIDDMHPVTAPLGAEAPAQCASDPPGPDATDNGAGCNVANLEQTLLGAGYALAGSAYQRNGAVPDLARDDTLALREFFVTNFGTPLRTLLIGLSMGSLAAYQLAEDPDVPIDGIITLGGIGAGTTRSLDFFIAFQVGLDAVGLWDPNWGEPGNVDNDLDFESEVLPSQATTEPPGAPRLEFLRRVLGASANFASESGQLVDGLVRPSGEALEAAELRISMFTIDVFIATDLASDWEGLYGEYGLQNLDHQYCLSASDREALAAPPYNLPAETIAQYLVDMNNHDITANPVTRATFEELTPFTGALARPVLAVKSTSDGVILPYLDTLYRNDVAAAQRSHLLVQKYVVQTTHANNYTPDQIRDAVGAMDRWVETGVAPGPADFPPGFDSGHGWDPSFVSPPSPFECLPEPGAVLSLAAGVALLFGLRRRRP